MPKTVTTDFENVQARSAFPVEFALYYKRRYWDSGTSEYIWEDDWIQVPNSEVKKFSVINQKLDTVQLNELLSSNVSPTLNNAHHVWEEGYNWSKFNADDVATDGYLPYLTKIQIRGGFRLDDGTTEMLNLFTGYAVKFPTTSKDDTMTMTVEGRERILKDADAEKVNAGEIEDETPTGAINGSNTVYTTANNGVGRVTEVVVDGAEIEIGKDCDISNLNEADLPATITCNVAPTVSITVNYFYWKQDQRFEDLAVDLLQEAGLTASEYNVSPVVFPNDVLNEWTQTDQADWQAGTHSNTEDTTVPGSVLLEKLRILDDFADGEYTTNPIWTVQSGTWSVTGTNLELDSLTGRITTPSSKAYGWWRINYQVAYENDVSFSFISNGTGTDVSETNGRYRIRIQRTYEAPNWLTRFYLDKLVSGSWISLLTYQTFYATQNVDIYRSSDNEFKLYVNFVLRGTVTDDTYTTSNFVHLEATKTDILNTYPYFRNFFIDYPPSGKGQSTLFPIFGQYITQTMDASVDVTGWDSISIDYSGGYAHVKETWSSDTTDFSTGNDPQGWIVATGDIPQSAVKQFLRARITMISYGGTSTPYLNSLTIKYYTSTTLISLADFSGQSVFDAISELAQKPDYEIGFDSDEKFFFRPKTTSGVVDFTFNESDGLIEIISRHVDYSRLKNWIRVTYGNYTKDVTPLTEADDRPNSFDKYGKRMLNISGGQIVISESADIATGIAQTFFERYKLPRVVLKIRVKYYPQIDLSDVVQVRFDPKKELERIRWDDGVSRWDDGVLRWDGLRTQVINYLTCKVTGISYNIDKSDVVLDLEEIL